jgi:acetoin utilization deacetylase AcuC-like enzyme
MRFGRSVGAWQDAPMPTGPFVVWSPEYGCDLGPHVFVTRKYALVRAALLEAGTLAPADLEAPPEATREELARVHAAAYLDDLEHLRETPRTLSSEIPLTAEIVRAARLAAGGTLRAARRALVHGASIHIGGGFHHAFAGRAEGFCYINDLAVATRVLLDEGVVRRVAVVDLDVHQGNGTAHIFGDEPDVFTLSLHQEANYPMPKPRGTLDIGLEDGTDDPAYARHLAGALEHVWAFEPQLVIYQAGADPYREDQLGGLALSREGLVARDREVRAGARARGIPAVVTLGGGYARRIEDTVAIHVATCAAAADIVHATARGRP